MRGTRSPPDGDAAAGPTRPSRCRASVRLQFGCYFMEEKLPFGAAADRLGHRRFVTAGLVTAGRVTATAIAGLVTIAATLAALAALAALAHAAPSATAPSSALPASAAPRSAPSPFAAEPTVGRRHNVRMVPLNQRIAWVHFPKCGSGFADTLLHHANASLPSSVVGSVEVTLSTHPLHSWFKGIFWEKDGKIGNHFAVTSQETVSFHGRLFGMFREPASRSNSMYNYFINAQSGNWIDERTYARRVAGSAVMMMAGQRYGLDCLMRARSCKRATPNTELALRRLKTEFAFVGLTNNWALSICLFHAIFGGPCLAHEFLNTRPTHTNPRKPPPATNTTSGAWLGNFVDKDDSALFSKAKTRFCADVAKHHVTLERCARICPAAPQDSFGSKATHPCRLTAEQV